MVLSCGLVLHLGIMLGFCILDVVAKVLHSALPQHGSPRYVRHLTSHTPTVSVFVDGGHSFV